jgi:hypothetical protein
MAARLTKHRQRTARRMALALSLALPLAACGHSDLRAPCGPLAAAIPMATFFSLFPLWPPAAEASSNCGPLKPANR